MLQMAQLAKKDKNSAIYLNKLQIFTTKHYVQEKRLERSGPTCVAEASTLQQLNSSESVMHPTNGTPSHPI